MFRAHISKKIFKKPAKYSSKYLSLISEENKINTSFAKEIGIEYESDLCSNEIGIDCSFFIFLVSYQWKQGFLFFETRGIKNLKGAILP